MSARTGILAVWNDRDPDLADFYEDWYVGQHLPERVGLPGWHAGRRYELANGEGEQFFTWYDLDDPSAATSEAYRARLNDPTPETTRIMAAWRNMTRSICERTASDGRASGAHVVTVRFGEAVDTERLVEIAHRCGALSWQVWQGVAEESDGPTEEQSIRGEPDRGIASALVLDAMRDADAARWTAELRDGAADGTRVHHYRLLCDFR